MKPPKIMEESIKGIIQSYSKIDQNNYFGEEKTFEKFIKPLFSLLGWDLSSKSSEVISINKISKNKVDHIFQIEEIPKFPMKFTNYMI